MPVRVTYTQLIRDFEDISLGLSHASSIMGEIGKFLEASILLRTSEGIDAEGVPFEGYRSVTYKELRRSRGLPVDKVDMFFGGSMLGALTFEYNEEQARVFFQNTPHVDVFRGTADNKTNAEIAYYNDQIRPFFSISAIEAEKIIRMFGDYVHDLLEK